MPRRRKERLYGAAWDKYFKKFEKWKASQKTKRPLPRASDVVKSLVRESLGPLLKENGFKKSGWNFWRRDKEYIQVLNVQLSQWNNCWRTSFTINLGIDFPSLARKKRLSSSRRFPKHYECFRQERLGILLDKHDHWWEVDSWMKQAEIRKIGKQTRYTVAKFALPWFEKHSDPKKARRTARRKI